MPAERTRGSKQSGHGANDGTQLVWTESSIAFAPNVTPVTFNDPPPMVDPPCEAILFPPADDCSVPRRPAHSKKKPENHIPRPPNAFILFRSSFIKSQHVSTEVETNHSTLSKIIGLTWQNLPHDERQVWHAKAKAALEEHKRKFPQYAFRPLHTKGRGPEKRKVREVGPKDLKRCAKIAELLVEGKKGSELDAAVQEFDRHHVPEIVTRFETPLTARQYRRRSSSVPIPDAAEPSPKPKPVSSSRRIRASSSQPTRQPSPPAPAPAPAPQSQEHWLQDFESDSAVFNPPSPFSSSSTPSSTYSFLPTPEPSFVDFSAFSFSQPAPTTMLPCSSHSLPEAPEAGPFSVFDHCSQSPPPRHRFDNLSINTSFMDDWTRSSSPTSMSSSSMPATPQSFVDSPVYSAQSPMDGSDHFATAFKLDGFEQHALSKSFDLQHLQIYPDDCTATTAATTMHNTSYIPADYNPLIKDDCYAPSFEHMHMKPEMGLDFSTLMASLPPYTI